MLHPFQLNFFLLFVVIFNSILKSFKIIIHLSSFYNLKDTFDMQCLHYEYVDKNDLFKSIWIFLNFIFKNI